MQAILALEDGRIFRGKGYGAKGECHGEVVFNTSITGYQEIFTDPSYSGQIVVLTNPEIGNYGTNPKTTRPTKPYIEGLVVREFSRVSSQLAFAASRRASIWNPIKIPVLADIDTRALVRHLRDHGRHARRDLDRRNSIRKAGGEGARRSRKWTAPTWPRS